MTGEKKYVIIYNPRARNAAKLSTDEISALLTDSGVNYSIYTTKARGDGIMLAQSAVDEGASRIYAAGGDGTLNEVVSGLMSLKKAVELPEVCPVPLGTVNVFAKEMGFSCDALSAFKQSLSATAVPMDIGGCDERYFIMMASAGLDGFVVSELEKMIACDSKIKKLGGSLAYVAVGLKAIFKYGFPKFKVTARSVFGVKDFYADFVVVSNIRYYGGKFVLSPGADPCDGYLDLFMLNSNGVKDYFKFFFDVIFKRLEFNGLDVSRYRIKECEVAYVGSERETYSQIDGELYKKPPVKIKIYEKALKLVVVK